MIPDPSSSSFWRYVYQAGLTGWDLGGPTPVFSRIAETNFVPPGKMIVLGAGRGHDARMFARHDFAVTAVDFAAEAIHDMHSLADEGAPIAIINADLFALPPVFNNHFDYVLDYTCFCAIEPSRRGEYADVVKWLLKSGGMFISLVFPIGDFSSGPPFGVDPKEVIALFTARSFSLHHREMPADSIKPRRGREELVMLKKV